MTSVDDPAAGAEGEVADRAQSPADASAGDGTPGASGGDRAGRGLRGEVLLAVELAGLCAFAFSRSVLDSFGRSPETFVARGADAVTVIGFGLLVTLVPVGVLAAVGAIARAFGARVRWRVHLVLLGVLGGLAVWRLGQDITGYPGDATKLLIAGCLAVPLFVVLRVRMPSSRSFLRYAGAASVIFLVQFLFMSPASTLIGGGVPGLDADVTRAVQAALGDDAPPVVFVITDTFPTQALVDGTGNIDAELYPNIAALASTGTWYRNNTTVSGYTNEAVPALLSGLYPKPSEHQEFVVPYPNNLFTLLGGTYDLHVHEPMTRLCPEELCPRQRSGGGLGPLAGDAVDLWLGSAEAETAKLDIPGLFLNDRYADLEAWIDAQDFRRGPRPDLFFYHAMLPHEPWAFLPDGSVYEASDPPAGIFSSGWGTNGHDVGRQRLVLQAQATDRLLGRLFDRMRAAGTFDDALIVVAGDHGQAFVPEQPWRAASEGNHDQIMWTPLVMKQPGQTAGEISDANVETVDVLPTLAHGLGVDLPFRSDGLVAGVDQRDPDVKLFDDVDSNRLRSSRGEPRVEVAARPGLEAVMAADPVPATGEDAVWKRTAYGDLVGRGVSDLRVGPSSEARVTLSELGRFGDIDLGDPLPIEALGATDEPPGTVLAFALNGTVAGVTEVGADTAVGHFVQSLLVPRLFVDGANELRAYLVEGPVGSETLRPVELVEPG